MLGIPKTIWTQSARLARLYDQYLLIATLSLLAFGLLMVASTSLVVSEHQFTHPFHYVLHHSFYICVGLLAAAIVVQLYSAIWQQLSSTLLLGALSLLVLVLVPHIGRQVNGSLRWLGIGLFVIQVSELAKLAVIIYLASYLARYENQVRSQIRGFLKPLLLLSCIAILLLREPDFGGAAVILATSLGTLFLAGVRIWQFCVLAGTVGIALGILATSAPYRLARLTGFLNPWANQFNSGYQLTQALIAFGRGGWYGVGLGDGVQKLFYLPEAHTDFLFAVLAEELGLVGSLVLITLFTIIVSRALSIGYRCLLNGRSFAAYTAYGIGLSIGLQAMVNIGVNTGLLPTKGLTLPLVSYGGSSLLVSCIMMALLLRIDHESRLAHFGFRI